MNITSNFDFICVSGYGKSGSGACINLLKEFEYIDGIENEFRIAKDPFGLLDLEMALVTNWEFVKHDTSVNDFLNYCHMLSRNDGIFKKVGKGFSQKLNVDFLMESENYIKNITNFTYYGDTLLHRYRISAFQSLISKLKTRQGLTNEKLMYFSKPSYEFFLSETRKYIRRLHENYVEKNNLQKVVLNQSVVPTNIKQTIKFFNSNKLVIVDRDPRDIYATMNREKRLLGGDKLDSKKVDKYIFWHFAVREKSKNDSNTKDPNIKILELRFEDFFVNYEKTISNLIDFLEIDSIHVDKGKKFDPQSKNKHVGIWKNEPDQKSMEIIYNKFPDMCYHD